MTLTTAGSWKLVAAIARMISRVLIWDVQVMFIGFVLFRFRLTLFNLADSFRNVNTFFQLFLHPC